MTRRRGSAALEMAAAAPILVLLLVVGVDFAFASLIDHQLGYAARIGSRYGITGQAPTTPDGNAQPVALCEGGGPGSSPRLTKIRELIAGAASIILRPERLCLAVLAYQEGFAAVGKPEEFTDLNGNGSYDPGEVYADVNGDGRWSADRGEAAVGEGSAVTIYALRYSTPSMTGMTPGLPDPMRFEARVVVTNEPFR